MYYAPDESDGMYSSSTMRRRRIDFCCRAIRNKQPSLLGMSEHTTLNTYEIDVGKSPIGLLKMHATQSAQQTANDAVQIFGGRGITKTGMGEHIEHVSSMEHVEGNQLIDCLSHSIIGLCHSTRKWREFCHIASG